MLSLALMSTLFVAAPSDAETASWSAPEAVRSGKETCVTYKAQLRGSHLVISADHEETWHTYALDNALRVEESLAGKPSLGQEMPTSIKVEGVTPKGGWLQSRPEDMSQPELRWYRWGFSDQAYFAIEVDPTTFTGLLTVRVEGQACDVSRCRRVDVALKVSEDNKAPKDAALVTSLEPARTK